jgi:hypothetical protein
MESTVAHEQGCMKFHMKRNKVRGGGRKSIIISESITTSVLQHFVEILISKNTITGSITTAILKRTYKCNIKLKLFPFILKLNDFGLQRSITTIGYWQ